MKPTEGMWCFKQCKNLYVYLSEFTQKEESLFTTVNEKFISKSTDRGKSSTVITALAFTSGKANSVLFEFKTTIAW